jgi:hypothetical protein
MRVMSRIALVVLAVFVVAPLTFADILVPECPLTLVGDNAPASSFALSPHGVFRNGSLVYVLRGQTLTTYNVTDLGDVQIAREDFLASLGARDTNGGTAFSGGFLYISGEAGLEVYDLRNVRAGGSAPTLISRMTGLHYRRMTVSGTQLAGVYPISDFPCAANGVTCYNSVDVLSIANPFNPVRVGTITSFASAIEGVNDIAFNYGFLYLTGPGGTFAYSTSNPAAIMAVWSFPIPGTFLISNTTDLLGVGNDTAIEVFTISTSAAMTPFGIYTTPTLTPERANPIVFHPQGYFDEPNGRMITMVDEKNMDTLQPARTIAFDVFDFTVPFGAGTDPRPNETVSYVGPDEVKFNPTAVGPFVYTVGQMSGFQSYGACGNVTGHIDWDGTTALTCGGAQIHGWVTGSQKIMNVELLFDSGSLGSATLGGAPRIDVPSPARTPITAWAINVNLDQTSKGVHVLRAVGTDTFGNRRQFAFQRVLFNGPGLNCTNRRRSMSSQ